MFELIDEAVTNSEYDTAMAIFSEYCKIFTMENEGLYLESDYVIQEGDAPKRKTTLEKIIFFIPDMIRKFIQFIKSKLNKLFNKKPSEIVDNVKNVITGSKDDKNQQKKIIGALAAVGVTAAASAAGYIIYDKHKKNVLTFEEDTTGEIGVTIVYDIPNMIESLMSSVEVSNDVSKLYSTSNASAFEKDYKSIIKKLKKASESLSNAVKPNTTMNISNDGNVHTVQQLMKELKQLSTSIDKISDTLKIMRNFGDNRPLESSKDKYNDAANELNSELSIWVNEFNQFMSRTSDFISILNSSIEVFVSTEFYKEGGASNYNFGYLSTLVTYCSYESSALGFQFSAIDRPWQKSNKIEPSRVSFDNLGKTGKIISDLFSDGIVIKPAWGHIGNDWFVLMPRFNNHNVKGTDGYVHRDTNENYAFIFKSPEEFSKMTQFIRNSSKDVLAKCAKHMMTPTESTDDNPSGIIINRDFLSKLMYTSQKAASGLSKDLQPEDNEIFFNVYNAPEQDIHDNLGKYSDIGPFTLKKVKTQPGVVKITLGSDDKNNNTSSSDFTQEQANELLDLIEAIYDISKSAVNK